MKLHVLMIDDHPPIIEGYKAILSCNSFGYEITSTSAYSIETAYSILSSSSKPLFDVVFIDITLPPCNILKVESGADFIHIIKKHAPNTKIVVLTSHSESLLLHKLINNHNPNGVLIKSDFMPDEFLTAFDLIVRGSIYYSSTIKKLEKNWSKNEKVLDSYNSQILQLLTLGIKTKNMPEYLHLSQSAIDKRKSILKSILGIDKGNDEDILKEARKQGLI